MNYIFQKEQGREISYIILAEGTGTVICEIPEGECPYGNEGKRMYYADADTDSNSGLVCVCISDGFVEEAGLLEKSLEEKKERDREEKRENRRRFRPF